MIFKIISIGLILFLFGCKATHQYELENNENLSRAFILNSAPMFKGYYYKGSDSLFHYFMSKWDFKKDKYFKISINELKVIKPFSYNEDSIGQRIDLISSSKEEFGRNEFYTLYNVK